MDTAFDGYGKTEFSLKLPYNHVLSTDYDLYGMLRVMSRFGEGLKLSRFTYVKNHATPVVTFEVIENKNILSAIEEAVAWLNSFNVFGN